MTPFDRIIAFGSQHHGILRTEDNTIDNGKLRYPNTVYNTGSWDNYGPCIVVRNALRPRGPVPINSTASDANYLDYTRFPSGFAAGTRINQHVLVDDAGIPWVFRLSASSPAHNVFVVSVITTGPFGFFEALPGTTNYPAVERVVRVYEYTLEETDVTFLGGVLGPGYTMKFPARAVDYDEDAGPNVRVGCTLYSTSSPDGRKILVEIIPQSLVDGFNVQLLDDRPLNRFGTMMTAALEITMEGEGTLSYDPAEIGNGFNLQVSEILWPSEVLDSVVDYTAGADGTGGGIWSYSAVEHLAYNAESTPVFIRKTITHSWTTFQEASPGPPPFTFLRSVSDVTSKRFFGPAELDSFAGVVDSVGSGSSGEVAGDLGTFRIYRINSHLFVLTAPTLGANNGLAVSKMAACNAAILSTFDSAASLMSESDIRYAERYAPNILFGWHSFDVLLGEAAYSATHPVFYV